MRTSCVALALMSIQVGARADGGVPLPVEQQFNRFVRICRDGIGSFPAGSAVKVEHSKLPTALQDYYEAPAHARFYEISSGKNSYFIAYERENGDVHQYKQICALAVPALALGDAIDYVSDRLNVSDRPILRKNSKETVYYSPSGEFEIRYRYVSDFDTSSNSLARGERYAVSQFSFYSDEKVAKIRRQRARSQKLDPDKK